MMLSREDYKKLKLIIKYSSNITEILGYKCDIEETLESTYEEKDALESTYEEKLEATYAEMDEKELQHEKARRELELQLEKATDIIKRNQAAWYTSLDARRGLLPEVYLSNKEYLRRITENG